MLPTIPFHQDGAAKKTTKVSTDSISRSSKSHKPEKAKAEHTAAPERLSSTAQKKASINPWQAVMLVVAVAVLGILIIRFSRAAGTEPVSIPLNQTDIQNFVVAQTQTQPVSMLDVSGYAQFAYTPQQTTVPVTQVAYYLDQKLIETVTQKPYNFILNTTRISNGEHQLTAVAFDSTNAPVAATSKTLNVQNSTGIIQQGKNLVTYPWYALFNL